MNVKTAEKRVAIDQEIELAHLDALKAMTERLVGLAGALEHYIDEHSDTLDALLMGTGLWRLLDDAAREMDKIERAFGDERQLRTMPSAAEIKQARREMRESVEAEPGKSPR